MREGAERAAGLIVQERWERQAGYPGWENRAEELREQVARVVMQTAMAVIVVEALEGEV